MEQVTRSVVPVVHRRTAQDGAEHLRADVSISRISAPDEVLTSIVIGSIWTDACFRLDLAPGIYATVDSTVTHLSYTPGVAANTSLNVISVELGKIKFTYKGESSGVRATGKFEMVIDPEKRGIRKTPKIYDPFIKSMTSELIMIVPLEVVKNKRVYDEGMSVQGEKLILLFV